MNRRSRRRRRGINYSELSDSDSGSDGLVAGDQPQGAAAADQHAADEPKAATAADVDPQDPPQEEENVAAGDAFNVAVEQDNGPGNNEPQPDITLLEVLRIYKLDYIYHLSIGQMVTLALKLIQSNSARTLRPPRIQQLIDAHHRDFPDLHDQEMNELSCMMDYLIKLKANIVGLHRLLQDGDRRVLILSFPNDDFDGNITPDVFVSIPGRLDYEICQGAAMRLFANYRAYGGHSKTLPRGRYMVGLFSARVYDTHARSSEQDGIPLGNNGLHYGVDGNEHRVLRLLVTGRNNASDPARLVHLANPNGIQHMIRLHRLVLVLANSLGITVFNAGMFREIGVVIPENDTYDDYIAYRPLTSTHERASILNALRVGRTHSLQCDGDHRLAHGHIYCNGLGHVQPTSHCMNACFIHVRRNAGHWCFGLHLSRYTDGTETNLVDTSFVDSITWGEGGQALFDGEQIVETDLFDVLPYHENWINSRDVDCYCSDNDGERCLVCIANENEEDESEEE